MRWSHPRHRSSLLTGALVASAACLLACSGADSDADPAGQGGTAGGAGSATAVGGAGTGHGGMGGGVATGGASPSAGGGSGGASNGGNGGVANAGSAQGGTMAGGAAQGGTMAGGAAQGGAMAGGAASGGSGGRGGQANGGGAGSGGASGSTCPFTGHITYTLAKAADPTATEQDAYTRITTAMDKALSYYNCHANITKALNVSYVPSVATADGNINGSMRFGSNTTYMDYRTAMHEIGHTLGVGQASNWGSFVMNGLFTGSNANAALQAINATLATPVDTQLHADTQHFWPYGINQQSEVKSEADLLAHIKIVVAMRKDLGLQ